jgi:peptidoglycan/xylan/chitin deacetylase (PgdA/CDA1 family)
MKKNNEIPHGVMFHYFHLKKPFQGSISQEQFKEVLDYIGSENLLSAEEWTKRAETNKLEKNNLCITFDDGLRCQYETGLPVLRKYGLTAFWFVNSNTFVGELGFLEIYRHFRNTCFTTIDEFYGAFYFTALSSSFASAVQQGLNVFPRNYLSEYPFYTEGDRKFRYIRDKILKPSEYEQIMNKMINSKGLIFQDISKELWLGMEHLQALQSKEHIIGLHSHTHPTVMANLPYDAQQLEYQNNFDIFSKILREKPFTMAHPCCSYSDDTLKILRDLGIRLGFRTNMLQKKYSLLELPREDVAVLLKEKQGGGKN